MMRYNKHALSILTIIAFVAISLLFVSVGGKDALSDRTGRNNFTFNKALIEVIRNTEAFYYKDTDTDQMYEGAIKGALSSLDDPYSFYLSPKNLQRESENLYHATFGGLGIHIYTEKEGGPVRIYRPLPNSPAMKAGLHAGDDIIGVNGVPIKIRPNGQRLEDVVDILRGKVGTDVTITVRRRGISEPFNVTLTRKKIQPKSVEKAILEDGIGYILIRQFTGRSSEEFRNAVTELRSDKQNELKAIILDLRHNPGGLLDAAHYVADAFIPKGVIVSTKGRKPRFDQEYPAKYPELCPPDIPLVVLVNGFSASGSEIVAGAIKDTGRGVILGTRTFGKGLVQQRFPLKNGGGAVSLTVSRYYTPSGVSINERLLFSTDLSFQSELDDGKPISDSLQTVFNNHGLQIPQDARISVEQQGSNWVIMDKANTLQYRIKKAKDKLGISINERSLFSTDLSLQSELDHVKPVSDSLRAVFENHGFPIPQSATTAVEQQGSKWVVMDKNNMPKYRIRKEKDKLGVYNEKGITPHVVIEPATLSAIEEEMRKKMRDGNYARHFVEKWIAAEEARLGTPPTDFSKLAEKLPELATILNEKGITLSEHLVKLEMRSIFNRNVGIYQLVDLENDNQMQEAIKILKAGEVGQILASATNQQTEL